MSHTPDPRPIELLGPIDRMMIVSAAADDLRQDWQWETASDDYSIPPDSEMEGAFFFLASQVLSPDVPEGMATSPTFPIRAIRDGDTIRAYMHVGTLVRRNSSNDNQGADTDD